MKKSTSSAVLFLALGLLASAAKSEDIVDGKFPCHPKVGQSIQEAQAAVAELGACLQSIDSKGILPPADGHHYMDRYVYSNAKVMFRLATLLGLPQVDKMAQGRKCVKAKREAERIEEGAKANLQSVQKRYDPGCDIAPQ